MKKFFKWTGITLLGLILIALLASWILAGKFNSKFEKAYALTPAPVAIPTDSASIERGRTLSVGCRTCHGVDLGGKVFFDDPKIGTLPSSNLTRAKGSQTEGYTDEDFVRAIRHGLNKEGHALMIMPSEALTHLSDHDLGCLIAFLKTLRPVERTFAKRHFAYMSQVMAGAGLFGNLFPYDIIDHEKAKNIVAPPMGPTPEYGQYIVNSFGCSICHTPSLGGGKSPDPAAPPVPDISMSGHTAHWTAQQFINTFKTGTTPEGKLLDGQHMPFAGLGALENDEIEAVYHYIRTLPPAHPAAGK